MTATLLVILCLLKLNVDAHFYDDYDADAALNVVLRDTDKRWSYRREDFTFDGVPGQAVPAIMALPKKGRGPYPALIFLHGIGQEKEFVDTIAARFVKAGYAIVSFDQFMQGERKLHGANPLEKALAFRRRAALTVIETRRLVDYLVTRDDIDPSRIFLLGASYGAVTGSTAVALDQRIRAAILCYGGGDIKKLIDSPAVRGEAGGATGLLKYALASLLAPADPLRHVDDIAPRPILIQSGRNDTIVPPAASQALIDAALEPKDIIWYDSDHVGKDKDHVEVVVKDAITWLRVHDRQ